MAINTNQGFFGENSNFFSDWASLKNGSYAKLTKAYYGNQNSSSSTTKAGAGKTSYVIDKLIEERKKPTLSKQAQEANSKLTAGIGTLKSSVAALQKKDTYTAEEGKTASDKVASALKNYVSSYNDVVSAAKKSTLSNKTSLIASAMKSTSANKDKLAEIGITINANGTLQFNEGKAKSADISKVQDLFSSDNLLSYGSTVASRLQFAGSTSTSAADSTKKEEDAGSSSASVSFAASLKTDSEALASDQLYEKIKGTDGKEGYNLDKIFATVKSFASDYNNMFEAAKSSKNAGVVTNLSYIQDKTEKNKDALKQFGITLDKNNKMKVDEDTLKKSDMPALQKFFKSYGPSINTYVSLVDHYSKSNANNANGYTATGTYNVQGISQFSNFV